jgi:hypothetical protein
MQKVQYKLENLIRTTRKDIKFLYLDVEKVKEWAYNRIPAVVQEMKTGGWDFTSDDTWLENTFAHMLVEWHGKKVCIFVTNTSREYVLCGRQLKTNAFSNFRKTLGIDMHLNLLLHDIIFMKPSELEEFFINFNFDTGYCCIDNSHFDEDGNVDLAAYEDWGFLSDDAKWTKEQERQVKIT